VTWLRRYARIILAVYSVLLLVALIAPTSDTQSGMVFWLGHVLWKIGAPKAVWQFSHLEVVMNALIIAPVSFFGSLVKPRWTWRDWTAYAFLAASAVELVQALLLPQRVAQFSDVVANAGGALVGAVVVRLCNRFSQRHVPLA
jgi:glycopeptide antibiotics resistance protein